MTLQEKINKKAEGFGKLAPVFLEGAKFVLESQWISIDEDKPWNHAELIDKNYNFPITKIIIVKHRDKSIGFARMRKREGQWKFSSDITHWLPIPDLPKEYEIELWK